MGVFEEQYGRHPEPDQFTRKIFQIVSGYLGVPAPLLRVEQVLDTLLNMRDFAERWREVGAIARRSEKYRGCACHQEE